MPDDEIVPIDSDEYYGLVSVNTVVKSAVKIRESLLKEKTNPEYVGMKGIYAYVPSNYMDDTFKKWYPIHKIRITSGPTVIANCWVSCSVEIEAFLSPSISIQNPGTACHRLNIPEKLRKALIARTTKPEELTPLDWIDLSNDFKAALTDAIKNAQSKFGVCADIYNKGILPESDIIKIKAAFLDMWKLIPNSMEQLMVKKEWDDLCAKKGSNLLRKFNEYAQKYNFFPEQI